MFLNRYETDSPLWVLLMASESIIDMSISFNLEEREKNRGVRFIFWKVRSRREDESTYLNLGTLSHLLVLRYGIGDDDSFKVRIVDSCRGITAKDTVRTNGIDLGGSGFLKLLSGQTESTASVGHIVNKDGNTIGNVADQYHGLYFVGTYSFLVNQSKVNVESVGNRCDSFGTAGIRRDNDGVLPVGYIVHNPLDHGRLGKQVIDWNVEKALFDQVNQI